MESTVCKKCGTDHTCTVCFRSDIDCGDERCEKCEKEHRWSVWIESALDAVEKIARKHGWEFDRYHYEGGFSTRSRYYELSRDIIDEDGDEDTEFLKLRISDHGSCYCSEELSLAMNQGGDDHGLEDVEARLMRAARTFL